MWSIAMERMQRTQIYLPPDLSEALDRLAQRRGMSRASLIRLAARQLLEDEQSNGEDPILGLIGTGDAGPGRVSEEHDRVLVETCLNA
jgi:predicted transcriptional regulator